MRAKLCHEMTRYDFSTFRLISKGHWAIFQGHLLASIRQQPTLAFNQFLASISASKHICLSFELKRETGCDRMVALARKWLNANVSSCTMLANGLSNVSFLRWNTVQHASRFSPSIILSVSTKNAWSKNISVILLHCLQSSDFTGEPR